MKLSIACFSLSLALPLLFGQQTEPIRRVPTGVVLNQVQASPAQIEELEQQVSAKPGDMRARAALLRAYVNVPPGSRESYRAAYLRNVQAIINEHPGDDLSGSPLAYVGTSKGAYADAGDHANLVALWATQVNRNFEDSKVILNAVRFLGVEDKQEAEALFGRVLGSRPGDVYVAVRLGFFYAVGLLGLDTLDGRVAADIGVDGRQKWTAHCVSQLAESSSTHVLLGAATALPNLAMRGAGGRSEYERWVKESKDLRQRAAALEPTASVAKAAPVEIQSFAEETRLALEHGVGMQISPAAIRVGPNVVASNLISNPQPIYPPLAVSARVQGSVRMAIQIGTDGTPKNIQLISGHPLLVNAAVEAVKMWRYKPTLLNGNPVEVATEVEVPFVLAPDR